MNMTSGCYLHTRSYKVKMPNGVYDSSVLRGRVGIRNWVCDKFKLYAERDRTELYSFRETNELIKYVEGKYNIKIEVIGIPNSSNKIVRVNPDGTLLRRRYDARTTDCKKVDTIPQFLFVNKCLNDIEKDEVKAELKIDDGEANIEE